MDIIQILQEEKQIKNVVDNLYAENYFYDIQDNINIVIDTENLYLSNDVGFPCLKLLEFLKKERNDNTKFFTLHFITKKYRNTEVILKDLNSITVNKVFNGQYTFKGVFYKETFKELDEISKNSSIYFYELYYKEDMKEIDDIFLLYLVYDLSLKGSEVYFYSNDYKMVSEHILTGKIFNLGTIYYSIYKYNSVKLERKLFKYDKINLKYFFSNSKTRCWFNFWKNLNFLRINKNNLL